MLDIQCVIQYGMSRDLPNTLQRCGRGGRAPSSSALFLVLYKPWAATADLSSLTQDLDDPDQPLQVLTKTSKKPDRTGVAMYRLIQSSTCIRRIFADYLHDQTPTGESCSHFAGRAVRALICTLLAVDFTNHFCCDRHDNGFNLAVFFPGKSHTTGQLVFVDQSAKAATSRPKYCPVKEREPLKASLYAWRSRVHQNDPYCGVRQILWILTDADIELICKTTRKSLVNVDQLKSLLGADSDWADEWGQQIIEEISSFDANESSL